MRFLGFLYSEVIRGFLDSVDVVLFCAYLGFRVYVLGIFVEK